MKPIIKLSNINKEYNKKNEKIKALRNITIEFEKNNLYAITGHSGSGKSTLINILGLIMKPTSGKYVLKDKLINNLNENELADIRLKEIGFVFQQFYLEENLTALENVCLPMLPNKKIAKSERTERAKQILAFLGLENRINHKPQELSGGEQQRVAIARALANNPEIILADEPTGNLDEKNEEIVLKLLKAISDKGKCVIIVSHSKEVLKYATKVLVIKNGVLKSIEDE